MDTFPDFTLPVSTGGTLSRSDLDGKPSVIYCYPKDMTPGCTTESCDFRDNLARIAAAGVLVLGLSADSLDSHQQFIDKHDLPFPLLSDEEQVLLTALGVWKQKTNHGKQYMGIERSTFLVGGDHRILRAWRGVKVDGHVKEVLRAIEELL